MLTERPFMKDYFPGYENYIWMDADTEVLDINGIKNLILGVEDKDIAIVPEINESYIFQKNLVKIYFLNHYLIMGFFV